MPRKTRKRAAPAESAAPAEQPKRKVIRRPAKKTQAAAAPETETPAVEAVETPAAPPIEAAPPTKKTKTKPKKRHRAAKKASASAAPAPKLTLINTPSALVAERLAEIAALPVHGVLREARRELRRQRPRMPFLQQCLDQLRKKGCDAESIAGLEKSMAEVVDRRAETGRTVNRKVTLTEREHQLVVRGRRASGTFRLGEWVRRAILLVVARGNLFEGMAPPELEEGARLREVGFRLTPAEHRAVAEAAGKLGIHESTWMREAVLRVAAARTGDDPERARRFDPIFASV